MALPPNGRYLSYKDMRTGGLGVLNLVTGETRRLTNPQGYLRDGYIYASTLSPDGKQVAYVSSNEDNFFDLRIIGLDGSDPRVLYRNEEVYYIAASAWSPDGKHILAVFSRVDGTNQIGLASVADGSVRVLKTLDWRKPGRMTFSPDGLYIVYDFPPQEDSPNRDMFLLATDGSREIPLVEHPANDHVLGWAPDGKRVLFSSDRTGSWSAWTIQVAGGKPLGSPALVKSDIGQRMFPIGFAGEDYYYELHTGMKDVYIATIDPATGNLLTSPTRVNQHFVGSHYGAEWSPDGQYLAYVRRQILDTSRFPDRGSTIVIRSLETGEEREFSTKLRDLLEPRWSPDGRSLVVPAEDAKGRWGLYRLNSQTGKVATLVQSKPGTWMVMPAWSPDGKAIFYMLHEDGEAPTRKESIVVRDLETAYEKKLVSARHIHSLALSPDGRQLVFIADLPELYSEGTLNIMPATGGEPRELLTLPEHFNELAWTPDGRHVLFTKYGEEKATALWRLPVEGGEPQKLELAMEQLGGAAVHPDGRQITFTAGRFKLEVWLMENFLPELKPEQSQ